MNSEKYLLRKEVREYQLFKVEKRVSVGVAMVYPDFIGDYRGPVSWTITEHILYGRKLGETSWTTLEKTEGDPSRLLELISGFLTDKELRKIYEEIR